MAATSATGKGTGSANKATTKELAKFIEGPIVVAAGTAESTSITSPPSSSANTVVFQTPLAGGEDKYIVLLTTLNGGYAYVNDTSENSAGEFTGFTFVTEEECTLNFAVIKSGIQN